MDVTILGRIGYDLYSEEPHVKLPRVRRFSRYLGGSSANMAVGLARLGARVGIVSCLGDDSLSEFLIEFLNAEHVDTSHVQRAPGYLPSLCLTEVCPPDRFPQVFYRHDAVDTMLRITENDLHYIAGRRMFVTNGTSLCASPSRESTYLALERAKRAGCRVVFDVDYRAMSWSSPAQAGQAVRLALPFIDVLIGNQPELRLVAGEEDLDRATAALRDRVPLLVSKLGEQGTRVWQGPESVFQAPYSVDVVSTIGAGDGFASGFLYALLAGKPVTECLHYGNAAAAIVVSRLSCSEAMPTLAEVEAMIRDQRKEMAADVSE
ncbi:MAG TPA: 5-dehydro-2-deoxygluconokinase [Candidatus Acidoferrales bacterium]|nr:5-dehydro-2-deoxygluconokinase [Candidatus Acidoferrales bacterium]